MNGHRLSDRITNLERWNEDARAPQELGPGALKAVMVRMVKLATGRTSARYREEIRAAEFLRRVTYDAARVLAPPATGPSGLNTHVNIERPRGAAEFLAAVLDDDQAPQSVVPADGRAQGDNGNTAQGE